MTVPKLYYRVLQTEGTVFKELKDYYDGLVIEAHILEQYSNFVTSLLSTLGKPFFIDPTHKFVHFNLEDIIEKDWFFKIIESYKISECLQEEAIDPELLRENLESFVEAVIKYQRLRLNTALGGLEVFGLTPELSTIKSQIILPPYFLIDGINTETYKLNLEILEKSIQFKGDDKLYAVLALNKCLLYSDLSRIISDFAKDGIDGFCVWITNFNECEEDAKILEKYIMFFKKLSKISKPVVNLYGGALSIFISKLGFIDCVVQGIGYGEYRNPFVYATGGYSKRYYIPRIHKFVPIHVAQELIKLVPELKCNCRFCQKVNILDVPEKIKSDILKKHYVFSRWSERQKDFNELYENLLNTKQLLDEHNFIEKYWPYLRHIENWHKILSKFIETDKKDE